MAGIGLTLRKLVANQTFLHGAAAYFSSGVIAAGPWLISVISLALIQGQTAHILNASDQAMLFSTITTMFVASLIATGPIQTVLTRQISDLLYTEDLEAIAPTFNRTLAITALGAAALSLPFVWFTPFPFEYRSLAASLFVTLSLIWLALVAVSGLQEYVSLLAAFLVGFAVSGAAMIALAPARGASGALAGFAFGQMLTLSLLVQRVARGYPTSGAADVSLLDGWREYWKLALIGLLYFGGIWIDKIAYWLSPRGVIIAEVYRAFPPYDAAILPAYLLTIPAMAIFIVNLETEFYQAYRAFFSQFLVKAEQGGPVSPGGTLDGILAALAGMKRAARSGFWTLVKAQGAVVLLAWVLAADLSRLIGPPPDLSPTFRVAILAASGQVFVLYFLLLLLYLDARDEALALSGLFAAVNLVLSGTEVDGLYGLGYLAATLAASTLGAILLRRRLARQDYITFMLQPLNDAASIKKRPRPIPN